MVTTVGGAKRRRSRPGRVAIPSAARELCAGRGFRSGASNLRLQAHTACGAAIADAELWHGLSGLQHSIHLRPMSLNIENLFVKCGDKAKVAELVEAHWGDPSHPVQPDWGLPSSFEPLLAREPKRKLAISPPQGGWVALVESKEVVDFSLANALSEKLETTVLAIQIAEASGAAGFASASRGHVLESTFNEEDDNPLATVRRALAKYRVPFDPVSFPEAVEKISEGWSLKQKCVGTG